MLTSTADIVVSNDRGPIAEVDVKNVLAFDLDFALDYMAERGDAAAADGVPYLMLASQELAYLWRPERDVRLADAPVWSVPLRPLLEPYSPRLAAGERLWNDELKVVVWTWLLDLTDRNLDVPGSITSESPLVSTGFLAALRADWANVTTSERD